jgi:hypothetical protein
MEATSVGHERVLCAGRISDDAFSAKETAKKERSPAILQSAKAMYVDARAVGRLFGGVRRRRIVG